MFSVTELPGWVVWPLDQFQECYRVASNVVEHGRPDERDRGVLGALDWLVIGELSPITDRSGIEVTWEAARAESWSALCFAAGMPPATARDFERLGVEPRDVRAISRQYAYGAWRALAWMLGVRDDWPVYSAWHGDAEMRPERPHMHVPYSHRDTAAWLAAARASREQDEADALANWRHVRLLADATDGADRTSAEVHRS